MDQILDLYQQKAASAEYKRRRRLKDPGSAITHFIGVVATLAFAPLLLVYRHAAGANGGMPPMFLFVFGLILLYGASTAYHSFDITERANKVLKRIDHMMIYMLIAGTYSPICLITLRGKTGYILFAVIWGMALLGVCQSMFWINCPKWVSSIIYISMGWTCIFLLPSLWKVMPRSAFIWLFAGGVIYTIGGVIYCLKLKLFNTKHKNFGSHEVFHLFCLGGSLCHFVMMFLL